MMTINIKEVSSKKELKQFIYLPAKIYKNNPVWVPPIYSDEWKYFDKNKYKPYKYCDTVLFLVYRGKEAVGRIMGIINKEYNALKNEKTARFEHFICYDDKEVAKLLLGAIDSKYRGIGLDTMLGVKTLLTAQKKGMTNIDSHLELETNTKVRAEMEKMGGKVYKRYRIYRKDIAPNQST